MGQTYQLEQIIRKVDASAAAKPADEVIVVFDRKHKKTVPAPGWFKRTLNNSLEYYLVANANDPRNKVECSGPDHVLRQHDPDVELPVTTHYTALCKPGDEEKAVLSLSDGNTPDAVLNDIIGKLIEEYHTGNEHLIRDFIPARGKLQNFVDTRVHALTGVTITTRFSYREVDLGPFRISPYSLPVSVCDYDDELPVKFSATLGAVKDDIRAVLNAGRLKTIDTRLTRVIQDFFAGQPLNDYYNEIVLARAGTVKEELKKELNSYLAPLGREILRYKIEGDGGRLQVDEFVEITCTITGAKIRQYPEPVSINNEMQLCLSNIAVFKATGINNLKGWVEKELARIVKQELFSRTYSQLIFEAEAIETSITEQLRHQVETIGYSIKHLISRPDLEEFSLTEPFTIDFSREFQTGTPEIAGKLQIVLTTRLNAIDKLKHYIDRQVDIKALIKDRIQQKIQSILHGVTAEDFYIYFDLPKENPGEKGAVYTASTSVRDQIIAAIEQILHEHFHADADKITVKQLETDIKKRHDLLIGHVADFSREITVLDAGETICFSGNFEVRAINAEKPGWELFCKRTYSIDELVGFFENSLDKELSAMPAKKILYKYTRDREAMEVYLTGKLGKQFIGQFGLIIVVSNLRRDQTDKEKLEAEVRDKVHENTLDIIARDSETTVKEKEIVNKMYLDVKDGQKGEVNKLVEKIQDLSGIEGAEQELEECRAKLNQLVDQPLKTPGALMALCSPAGESEGNDGFAAYIVEKGLVGESYQAGQIGQTAEERTELVEAGAGEVDQ